MLVTPLRMLLRYKTAISNRETPSKLWVRSSLWKRPQRDGQMFSRKNNPTSRENNSLCLSELLDSRLSESPPPHTPLLRFNYITVPFLLGVNTKQLSNQMLDLTKVINELKDVLIQQVL